MIEAPKTVVVAAMPETKSWTKSLGIMSPLIGVIVAVAALFGIVISPADIDAVVGGVGVATTIVTQILGLLGRATATKAVGAPGSATIKK